MRSPIETNINSWSDRSNKILARFSYPANKLYGIRFLSLTKQGKWDSGDRSRDLETWGTGDLGTWGLRGCGTAGLKDLETYETGGLINLLIIIPQLCNAERILS